MDIILSRVISIKKSVVSSQILETLENLATYTDPQWIIKRMKGFRVSEEERYLFSYRTSSDDQWLFFSRGLLPKLLEVFSSNCILVNIIDKRVELSPLLIKLKSNVTLFNYQQRALKELVSGEDAILVSDCGSGKTVIGAALIASLQQPTLIVVNTLEIMKQWITSITEFVDLWKYSTIGIIGQGKYKVRPITVATFQSLDNLNKEEWKVLNEKFGCLIMDEVQHASSESLNRIANFSKAKYRFGLTATPKRKDKREFLVFDSVSHRQIKVDESELETEGRCVSASVRFITSSDPVIMPMMKRWNGIKKIDDNNWGQLYTDISANKIRNELIINTVVKTVKMGHLCLLLSNRVNHCELLFNKLVELGYTVALVLGKQNREERKETMKQVRNGEIDITIATNNLAAEGLDIPILSCVHLLMPTANESFLKQATGRIRRVSDGKVSPLVVDYVDKENDVLFGMYTRRLKFYKTFGFQILNFVKK